MENRECNERSSESGGEPVTSDPSGQRPSSPDLSCVSLKSDCSMHKPPQFSGEPVTSEPSGQRSSSPDLSCVSLKSDCSMHKPPQFSGEPVTSEPSGQRSSSPDLSCVSLKSDCSMHKPPQLVNSETSDPSERFDPSIQSIHTAPIITDQFEQSPAHTASLLSGHSSTDK
ncbi:hypothetical protein QQF64_018719 [Cirrhinus molitorella]|uniref:Uncharacterized protein n=1 Tax=Cirrhinus molitorella TaxID=172907 RepID=A0ABR3LHF7_9TELE